MKSKAKASTWTLKIFLILLGLVLSTGAFWLSYKRTLYDLDSQRKTHLSQTKKDVEKALNAYNNFIRLIVFRLSHANPKSISSILAAAHHWKEESFPKIERITFDPKETTLEGFTFLGNNYFQEKRLIYDAQKNFLGTLTIVFSLQTFLQSINSKDVFLIKSKGNSYPLSFEILDFPYIFVLNPPPFSSKHYIFASPFYILVLFSLGITSLLMGGITGILISQNALRKAYKAHKKLTKELQLLKGQDEASYKELQKTLHLITLQEESSFKKQELLEKIQRHFREVARKIYAIHEVISKLLSQDLESPSTIEDIRILIRENNLILRQLVQGYPIESSSETISIHTLLNQIQTIFQPEITSKNILVRISPKSEITAHTNKLALEIVLYNIYVHLLDRFSQNNNLDISLYRDREGRAHLDFRDNGYVMRHKKGTPEERKDQSLFHLTQEELSDFVRILGWKLEWTQEKRGLNYIKLTLPLPIPETEKVIRLSDFKGSLL